MPVKPSYVKDIGRLLLERYEESIGPSFEHNKEIVDETTNIESKTVRNRVAGYITSKRRAQLRNEKPDDPAAE